MLNIATLIMMSCRGEMIILVHQELRHTKVWSMLYNIHLPAKCCILQFLHAGDMTKAQCSNTCVAGANMSYEIYVMRNSEQKSVVLMRMKSERV